MPIRLCQAPRCGNRAEYRGFCAEHARVRNRVTHPRNRAVYNSVRWHHLRRRALFDRPLCPCGNLAVDVHHITSLEAGGDPYDPANVLPLCKTCHGRITKAEQAVR